ncbi:MAG: D-alanine--D-alanine ligase [Candidatus Microgenomates bacterium]|jgi:D-alanine-D-alanine ligase
MRIALAFNVKKGSPSLNPKEQEDAEFDFPITIGLIKTAIEELGHEVTMVEANLDAFDKLRSLKGKIDLVFNIAEGLRGDARESQIPIFCEMLEIPYTHSTPSVHATCLNKSITKKILKADDVCVPDWEVISSLKELSDINLNFPLILKPNMEGSSKGVYDKNVVDNKKDLEERARFMIKNFGSTLVEEFIDGREFTVALLGGKPRVLPIVEQKFDFLPKGYKKIAGYELKWFFEDKLKNLSDAYDCPAHLTKKEKELIESTSLTIFDFLNVRDAARIDYRMDKKGRLYFLEVNTLPGLNFDPNVTSYFPLAARVAGFTPVKVVGEIISSAVKRFGVEK